MSGGRKRRKEPQRTRYRRVHYENQCALCGRECKPEHPAEGVIHYRKLNGFPVHEECLAAYEARKGESSVESKTE